MDWIDITVCTLAAGYVVGVVYYSLMEVYSENL